MFVELNSNKQQLTAMTAMRFCSQFSSFVITENFVVGSLVFYITCSEEC